jgi:two-component system cell cycle response regulator DivK
LRTIVVVVNALTAAGDRAKAYAAGCDGYLRKPFTGKELRSYVSGFLEVTV